MKDWQKHTLCLLAIITVVAGVFWPVLSGRATLVPTDMLHQLTLPLGANAKEIHVQNHYQFDVVTEIYPNALFVHRCLRTGQWPIWNPFIWCGFPGYALSTYSYACPFHALLWWLPMPAAFHWSVVLQLMAAGVFMYCLLRYWRLKFLACLLGALAYALNSEFVFCYWHATMRAFVWMPLIVLFVDKAMQGDRLRHSVTAGFFAGLAIISGSIQTAVFVLLLMGIYAAASAIVRRREWALSRGVFVTAVAMVVGVLLAAVQLLPCLEFMRLNMNKEHAAGWVTSFLDGLGAIPFLSTFAVPSLWGSTESFDLLKAIRASAGDFQGYIGIASLALILLVIAAWRESRVKVLTLCAATVLGLLLFIPFVRSKLYYRFFIAYIFAAAGLAACGLDQLLKYAGTAQPAVSEHRVRRVLSAWAIFLGGVILSVLVIQIVYAFWPEPLTRLSKRIITQRASVSYFGDETAWLETRVSEFWKHYRLDNPAFLIPLVAGVLAVVVVRARLRGAVQRACGPILVGLVVIDLATVATRLLPMIDVRTYPLYPPTAQTDYLQQQAIRVYRWPATGRRILQDDLLMVYRIRSFTGYASLWPLTTARALEVADKHTNAAALGICAVTHVLTKTNDTPTDPAFELVSENVVRIYRNTAALPRARFVSHYIPVADLQECQTIMAGSGWQPQSMPLIETDRQPETATGVAPDQAQVRIVSETTTEVGLTMRTPCAGYLLLADTFYPGWRAFVDGRPAKIHRANAAQRAVFVEPGEHRVQFQYAPASLRIGAAISGATILLCLGLWLGRPRRDKRSPSRVSA